MRKIAGYRWAVAAGLCLLLTACGSDGNSGTEQTGLTEYPFNNKNKLLQDTLWGERLPDPYRWLENINDQKVLNWAKRQNQTTFDYISQVPLRAKILQKLETLAVTKEYKKAKRDGRYYFYTVTREQPDREIVYFSESADGEEKLFVDPRKFSGNENARFASLCVSPDNRYAAFSLQDPMTRKEKIFVKNLETNLFMTDIVSAAYNSNIVWDNQGGFFYNKPFRQDFSRDTAFNAVFYHITGMNPKRDVPVYVDTEHPNRTNDVFITSDQRFVIIRSAIDDKTSEIRYTDLHAPPPNTFRLLTDEAGPNALVVDNRGSGFIVQTTKGAPKGRVVIIDPANPQSANWQTLIGETQDVIQRVYSLQGKFYVRASMHMCGKITAYDSSGYRLNSVELPGNGIVDGFAARPGYKDVLYTYQSFDHPLTVFRYIPSENRSEVFKQTENPVQAGNYVIKKEFCLTTEGVGIPLLIFHKKDLPLDGSHPLMLSFSGGMGESYQPAYSIGRIPFVDNGGVFVLAAVRGGNEIDRVWHDAGAGKNKRRMEEDVKLCLDYVIQEKYTSPGKVALLTKHTGAAAAVEITIKNPGVVKLLGIFQGVFDLTGYQRYGGCISCVAQELGDPASSKEVFEDLKSQSPLLRSYEPHEWPSLYLEHKIIDRVVSPVHSFKFIAGVQDAGDGTHPKLIRIDNECCVENRRQELFSLSERWAFAMYTLGMNIK